MRTLTEALDRLVHALAARGGPVSFRPFIPAAGGALEGAFEVRAADGRVKRLQAETLPLPVPLLAAFAHAAPEQNLALDWRGGGAHYGAHSDHRTLTLWCPAELIELQVGYRWHGFNGKRMREWDERYVVFAEDGADPLALRLDEPDGPVWWAPRGEGRYAFRAAYDSLAAFYDALARELSL